MENDLIVIGAGPAGMMAAQTAATRGKSVLLLDQNEKAGKKLFITGKGRCNITNDCDADDFFTNISRNGKFLMSAFHAFSNHDLIRSLNQNGLKTKVERGGRVFPESDKSNDVIKTLERMMGAAGVKTQYGSKVVSIEKKGDFFSVLLQDGTKLKSGALLIATGGKSYPLTGSRGDGYRFAQEFGHTIIPAAPALVPLEDAHGICRKMQGLTLKNVGFTLLQNSKKIYYDQGELLFTHFGLSGPLVLSASNAIHHKKQQLAQV